MGNDWLDGPFPFDENGGLVTGEGPQLADPAFRFRGQQGEELRAGYDLKRSEKAKAAVIRTPVNLPTWGHVISITRTFQERGVPGSLPMATADHRDAYKQLPLRGDHGMLAAVTLQYPATGRHRGLMPQAQWVGARAAVPRYNTVSRVTATMAAR